MEKDFFLNLNKEIYRLTLLFPKKEPLRYKMREIANEILAELVKNNFFQTEVKKPFLQDSDCLSNLEVLDCFFEIAKAQNWTKKEELDILQKSYSELKETLEKIKLENNLLELRMKNSILPLEIPKKKEFLTEEKKEESKEKTFFSPSNKKELNERQKKILDFLRENERVQVWQIKKIMPQVTKRTLRRDFEFLVKKGIIERMGERNNTFYQLKKQNPEVIFL